jgi:uncharacterized protein YyaL (SSP411 family)
MSARKTVRLLLASLVLLTVASGLAGAEDEPPIRWLEWQQATLAHAANVKKPVLVFLTASWCIECRQVEEEVLYHPDVRRRIQESFLPIRVDRERRPDLFARYSRGALPSLAFTLPSGNSLFFRDGEEYLRAGGANLSVDTLVPYLDLVVRQFRLSGESIDAMVQNWMDQASKRRNVASKPLEQEMAEMAASAIVRLQDPVAGGLKGPVKQARSEHVRAALEHYAYTGDEEYRAFAERTLAGLAHGAVRNPLDGSFYRVAAPDWGSPAPEQLVATQGEMLLAFLEAYRVLGKPLYRQVATELTDLLLDAFYMPEHAGFRNSRVPEDPQSLLWSWKQFRKAVKGPELRAAALHLGMDAGADERPRYLRLALQPDEVAAELGLQPDETRSMLEQARRRLQAAQERRAGLLLDDVILTGASAQAATALMQAWAVLGRDDALQPALDTMDHIQQALTTTTDGVFHGTEVNPRRILTGVLLWDQNQVARGCMTAYQVTAEPRFRDCAQQRLEFVSYRFLDKEWGSLMDRRPAWGDVGEEGIPDRRIEENADAAVLMFELGALVPGDPLWKRGRKVLEGFADEFATYGIRAIPMAVALHRAFQFPGQVAVVHQGGETPDAQATELRRAAMQALPVWKVVLPLEDKVDSEELRRFGILPGEGTAGYVVQGSTNRGPYRTVEELSAALAPKETP